MNKKKLWEIKQNHPIIQNWSNFDYSTFVCRVWEEYFDKPTNLSVSDEKLDNNNQLKTGFWVVRASSKGEKEKDILENNIITINWSTGDLSQFNDKESLKKEFIQLNPNQTKRSVEIISSELWKFAKEIKKGDIAILPQLAKGSNHNIAIAQVIDDYRYREDLPEIKNTRPITSLHKNIPIDEFADDLGVVFVNKTGSTLKSGSSSDLYVFTNGIKGNGPMGYQASIASTNAGDEAYSPLWRIQTITWENAAQAQFLTSLEEITEHAKQGHLKTEIAGVVVNCPFVEI